MDRKVYGALLASFISMFLIIILVITEYSHGFPEFVCNTYLSSKDTYGIEAKEIDNAKEYVAVEYLSGKKIKSSKTPLIILKRRKEKFGVAIRVYDENRKMIAQSKYYYMVPGKVKRDKSIKDYLDAEIGEKKDISCDGYNEFVHKTSGSCFERLWNYFPEKFLIFGTDYENIQLRGYKLPDYSYYVTEIICSNKDKIKRCSEVTENILRKQVYTGTDFEKLVKIQKYIILRTTYQKTGEFVNTAYGVLRGGANCDGYARAFKYLCDLNDIPCRVVFGETVKGEAHAYNIVKMKDKWYVVDSCWNDSNYEKGLSQFSYFLVSDRTHESVTPSYSEIKCDKDYPMIRV